MKAFPKPAPDPSRERILRDPEQILAWLEELARIGTPMDLEFGGPECPPTPGRTERVGEETCSCTFLLQRPPSREPAPGQKVRVLFSMDLHRYQADLIYLGRGGYLEFRFQLPGCFRRAERRESARVHLRGRDLFHIVALQGLFDGLGLSGDLADLSMGGCQFLVRRAIRVQDEKRLAIHADLIAEGAHLALVRIPDLPRLPPVESGGRVSHLRSGPRGISLGIAFEGMDSVGIAALAKFLEERIPGFSLDFPHKRRFKDLTEEERKVPQTPVPPDDPVLPEEAPVEEDAPAPETETGTGDPAQVESPHVKIQKRGKKILLVMGDGLDRTLLRNQFHQDGYRCLFEASSLVQAMEANRRLPLDLLVVDQTVGALGALQLVSTLRENGLASTVPVVVVKRAADVRLQLSAKAKVVSLLVERPVNFAEALKRPIEVLLGIRPPEPRS